MRPHKRQACFVCGKTEKQSSALYHLGARDRRYVCNECADTTCTRCWQTDTELLGDQAVCARCCAELDDAAGQAKPKAEPVPCRFCGAACTEPEELARARVPILGRPW